METKEAPKHVILVAYNPKLKKDVEYDALVVGSRELPNHDELVLNLVHFRHDDVNSHHALNGVDWADTLERTLDVPHEDDKANQSFFWKDSDDSDDQASELRHCLENAREYIGKLEAEFAETTEGRDKALQALADATAVAANGSAGSVIFPITTGPTSAGAGNVLPITSVDASAPANETKQYSDGSSATGPGPLPEQSPAQQEAASAQASQNEAGNPSPNTN